MVIHRAKRKRFLVFTVVGVRVQRFCGERTILLFHSGVRLSWFWHVSAPFSRWWCVVCGLCSVACLSLLSICHLRKHSRTNQRKRTQQRTQRRNDSSTDHCLRLDAVTPNVGNGKPPNCDHEYLFQYCISVVLLECRVGVASCALVRLTVTTVVTSVSERRVSRRRGGRTSALTDRLGD